MDIKDAIIHFSALAQETRLEVFRLLVKAGGDGMLAGEIADALGVKQNTMSANLSVLSNAGLLQSSREGRYIRYSIDFENLSELLSFLMEDCCGGDPEACQVAIAKIMKCC
ncbi:MAG: metalloregulator ArsR/SmtB family transcription factor [Lentilitoribacter sp.]